RPRALLHNSACAARGEGGCTSTMSNDALTVQMPSISGSASRPADSRPGAAPSSRLSAAARFLRREPLLHFCLLGALIFGVDAVLHPAAKDDKVIVVTKAMRQSFIDNFDEDKERVPSDTELEKMIESWVASEILYREGKMLAVDRGDDMIRDR